MASSVRLVVQADDFGMCHAVNAGVTQSFTEGIVTQSSMMVPCPWFSEAAALATTHGLPVGMHQTLTCEWDFLRWRPLTGGKSLARSIDGTMRRTLASVIEKVSDEDATAELHAQVDVFLASGLALTYLDVHMGMTKPSAYEAIAARTGAPFLYPGVAQSLSFASIYQMSAFEPDEKRARLLRRLERIATEPGVHLVVGHPAVGSNELRSIAAPDAYNAVWAEPYRVSDIELLCDRSIRERVDELGIELVSVAEVFAPGGDTGARAGAP